MFSIASDVQVRIITRLMYVRGASVHGLSQTHPKEIHLCVAIVQYKTKLKISRRGVCTNYLSSLRPGMLHFPLFPFPIRHLSLLLSLTHAD